MPMKCTEPSVRENPANLSGQLKPVAKRNMRLLAGSYFTVAMRQAQVPPAEQFIGLVPHTPLAPIAKQSSEPLQPHIFGPPMQPNG